MGKVQTSSRGSSKQAGRWTCTGCMRGDRSQKETQTAQGHRRSTKETRASVRIAGSRWCHPRAQGLQTSAKAVSPQTSSGTGHTRLATERWVMERMQKNNTCFCKQRKEAALCNLPLWNCCHTQRNSPKESFHTTQP